MVGLALRIFGFN